MDETMAGEAPELEQAELRAEFEQLEKAFHDADRRMVKGESGAHLVRERLREDKNAVANKLLKLDLYGNRDWMQATINRLEQERTANRAD